MENKKFAAGMSLLMELYGRMLTAQVLSFYWEQCKNMSDSDFERCLKNIVSTFKPTTQCPFPVPSDFAQAIGVSLQDRARNAVGLVKHAIAVCGAWDSVSFNDEALHAIIVRFGGWGAVCRWSDKDWQINSRAFMEAYESAARSGLRGPKYLPGVFEIENEKKYPDHEDAVKMIAQSSSGRYVVEPKSHAQIEGKTPSASGEIEDRRIGDLEQIVSIVKSVA